MYSSCTCRFTETTSNLENSFWSRGRCSVGGSEQGNWWKKLFHRSESAEFNNSGFIHFFSRINFNLLILGCLHCRAAEGRRPCLSDCFAKKANRILLYKCKSCLEQVAKYLFLKMSTPTDIRISFPHRTLKRSEARKGTKINSQVSVRS